MARETVVLIHGLWLNGMDMSLLRYRLRKSGYHPLLFRYPGTRLTPRENAVLLNRFLNGVDAAIVHFVCHSLGGLVIRHLFNDWPGQRPGRVVTLGTPHKPSYCAYRLAGVAPGRKMLGQSIIDGLLGNVPAWKGTHDLGSVAGTLRLGMGLLIPGLPAPNDGTVAVEETRLKGMKDHATINASHFGMLLSTEAARMCATFLEQGFFRR